MSDFIDAFSIEGRIISVVHKLLESDDSEEIKRQVK